MEQIQERLKKLRELRDSLIKEKEEKEILKRRVFADKAQSYLNEGLPYAEKLFEWAKNFKNSDIGRQFFDLIEPDNKGVKIIWLGILENDWQINIREGDGLIGYSPSGKPICNYVADSPKTLALWISPKVLKSICLHIENDLPLLYDTMERQIQAKLESLRFKIDFRT